MSQNNLQVVQGGLFEAPTSSKPLITLIEDESGDWEALYINGRKVEDNHSVDAKQVLEELQKAKIITLQCIDVAPVEYEETASFPDELPADLTTIPGYQA